MSFDIGPTVQLGPSFRISRSKGTMSDDPQQIQIKKESQVGMVNVEDLTVTQTWFPLHIQSVGSILVVGIVIIALICFWRSCRKKPLIKMFHFCLDCRKSKAEREQERVVELLERKAAAQSQNHEASTSHHHHHRGNRGHRHAKRGGHNSGLARGHGLAVESPRNSGYGWSQAEESQMTRAVKSNLETLARLAMPEVHVRTPGARPKEDDIDEEDDINVSK